MKSQNKISARERWILAIAPGLLIAGVYGFYIVDGLSAGLLKEQQRSTAAMAPVQQGPGTSSLSKARQSLESAKREVANREALIAQLDAKIAALPKAGADRDAASVIEKVDAVFARNGITPVTSEPADEGGAAANVPTAILDVLAPPTKNDPAGRRGGARVWHCIFDDQTYRFQRALKELTQEAPMVVPLSMNLVYNPANLGESHLMELWLLY